MFSQQASNVTQRQQNEVTRLIKCKLCQYPTEVPIGGIRSLPQNFLLVRRIEEIRFKVGEEVITRIWCSLCYEETNVMIVVHMAFPQNYNVLFYRPPIIV